MQREFDSACKWIVRFCNPAFPERLPDAVKPWLTTILYVVAAFCFVHFRARIPLPDWAVFIGLFSALLFVCMYIRGHSLIQAELAANAAQMADRAVAEKEAKEHKARMDALEEKRRRDVKFKSGGMHPHESWPLA